MARLWLCALIIALLLGSETALQDNAQCSGYGIFDSEWDECTCQRGYSGEACEVCADGYAGWPDCRDFGAGGTVGLRFGWAELCSQIADLRTNQPSFIARLGEAYVARQQVSKSRSLEQRNQTDAGSFFWGYALGNCSKALHPKGPWRIKIDIAAPTKAPAAYQKHHRMVLVFGDDWPVALPKIRFVGKIGSSYATSSDQQESPFGQDLHSSNANGLLLRRIQESVGGSVQCMWRQTGGCTSDGRNREPERDKLCSDIVPRGSSGFCDCNGNGVKDSDELGYGCESDVGSCITVCKNSSNSDGMGQDETLPRHSLRNILEMVHRSLGEPLAATDKPLWNRYVQDFASDVSTVLKYEKYGRLHPGLFKIGGILDPEMIDPGLSAAIAKALSMDSREAARRSLLDSGLIEQIIEDQVYSFRALTQSFCKKLMEEIHNFYGSKLPARRPNSMNNYGIILNEIGLEPLIFSLQDSVIQPLAALLLPVEGSEIESHHSFTIRYRGHEDTHLDVHTDDSDVTFNVNIFENYTGAPLVFCGLNGAPDHRQFKAAYQHQLGYAVLHRGRHRHGAEDITSGERMNMVVWSYSHNYRSSVDSDKRSEREIAPPDARCVSYTHDRDFGRFKTFPPGKKDKHLGRGWCPQRGKEYDGFVPDVPDSQVPRRTSGQ